MRINAFLLRGWSSHSFYTVSSNNALSTTSWTSFSLKLRVYRTSEFRPRDTYRHALCENLLGDQTLQSTYDNCRQWKRILVINCTLLKKSEKMRGGEALLTAELHQKISSWIGSSGKCKGASTDSPCSHSPIGVPHCQAFLPESVTASVKCWQDIGNALSNFANLPCNLVFVCVSSKHHQNRCDSAARRHQLPHPFNRTRP